MAPQAKFHDPDQVVIIVGGITITGYADGEFVTVEQMSPGFDDVVGTDGEVARSKTNDRRVKVVIKLLQTSASNPLLSALHQADLNAPNGAGVVPFLMQDLQGGTIVQGAQAWITSYPQHTGDRTAKNREWEIRIANGNRAEAGN